MTQAPFTRRSWYQFGLGTLFLLVLCVALASWGLAEHSWRRRAEFQAVVEILSEDLARQKWNRRVWDATHDENLVRPPRDETKFPQPTTH
jgi:hypothetical protein